MRTPAAARSPTGLRAACYTARDIQALIQMSRASFTKLKREGKLPFLEEIKPRLGRVIRYRADLVDTYLRNEWQRPRFGGPRRAGLRRDGPQ